MHRDLRKLSRAVCCFHVALGRNRFTNIGTSARRTDVGEIYPRTSTQELHSTRLLD
jgi:hypothetical protein